MYVCRYVCELGYFVVQSQKLIEVQELSVEEELIIGKQNSHYVKHPTFLLSHVELRQGMLPCKHYR
jgi:hypothetical protein